MSFFPAQLSFKIICGLSRSPEGDRRREKRFKGHMNRKGKQRNVLQAVNYVGDELVRQESNYSPVKNKRKKISRFVTFAAFYEDVNIVFYRS